MLLMRRVLLLFVIFVFANVEVCIANDFEELCKDGYGVIVKTYISGTFEGCDYNKSYKLANGLIFQCNEYNYSYNYNPDVYILQNRYGNLKVIIDDEEFYGTLYK